MHYVEKLFQSLEPLYSQPWFPYAAGVLGILFAYSVFMSLKSLPKLVMYPIIVGTCAVILMNWAHNRNEPEVLSPLFDAVTPWLPTSQA